MDKEKRYGVELDLDNFEKKTAAEINTVLTASKNFLQSMKHKCDLGLVALRNDPDGTVIVPDLRNIIKRTEYHRVVEIYTNSLTVSEIELSIAELERIDLDCSQIMNKITAGLELEANTYFYTIDDSENSPHSSKSARAVNAIFSAAQSPSQKSPPPVPPTTWTIVHSKIMDAPTCPKCNELLLYEDDCNQHNSGIACASLTAKNEMVEVKWEEIDEEDSSIMAAVAKAGVPHKLVPTYHEMWAPSWVVQSISVFKSSGGFAGMTLDEFLAKMHEVNK